MSISSYLLKLKQMGRATATLSRNMVSIRSFYQYMVKERMLENDPSMHMETPKLEKRVPKVLSVSEMERLLESPPTSTPNGMRDKAMLEVLYATGIRVSELVSLDVDSVDLTVGFIRCVGKAKERIVPLGSIASQYVAEYIEKMRPKLLKKNPRTRKRCLSIIWERA